MNKESLLREIDDWIARSHHEAKLCFEEGDLRGALAWGSKVARLRELKAACRQLAHDSGDPGGWVRAYLALMDSIVREMDPMGDVGRALNDPVVSLWISQMDGLLEESVARVHFYDPEEPKKEDASFVQVVPAKMEPIVLEITIGDSVVTKSAR